MPKRTSAECGSIPSLTRSVSVPAGDDSDDGLQISDPELGSVIKYLELPTDQKVARRIVAESPQLQY